MQYPTTNSRAALSNPWSWPRVSAALLIAVVSCIWWAAPIRAIFTPVAPVTGVLHESFTEGRVLSPQTVEVTGFSICPDGWCLNPGVQGTLVYRFRTSSATPFLNVWFYAPAGGTSRLSVSVHGGERYQVLSENARLTNARLDLGIRVTPGDEVWLRFDATNPTPNQVLVVDELKIVSRGGSFASLPATATVQWIVVSFGLAAVVLSRNWKLALTTLAIVVIGAGLRYAAAATLVDSLLDPDAITFRIHVDRMKPFTESGFFSARFNEREPFFIFVAWLYGLVVGNTDFGLRMLTVMLSTACIWATLRVGRLLFGIVPGQLIGLAIAVNGPLIAEAARGLRIELEILLCMAYFTLAFLTAWKRVLPAAAAMSAAGVILVMTRSTYMPVVLVLNAYAFLEILAARGGTWREALSLQSARAWVAGMAITVAIIAAGVVPHRYNMYKLHGDPFWDTGMYARWNANFEFAGKPGFPTIEELQKDGYVGPRLTYDEYMFGMHTPGELLVGTVRGYYKLFRNMELCPWWVKDLDRRSTVNIAFQVVAAAGLVASVWFRNYRWIPLAFMLMEFPVSFLFDRKLVEPYRHAYSAFPLVLFSAMVMLTLLWNVAFQRRRSAASVPVAAL